MPFQVYYYSEALPT